MRRLAALTLLLTCTIPGWARELTHYALVLSDPSAIAAAPHLDRRAVAAARSNLLAAHDAVKTQLRSRNIAVTGETRTLSNAVFVAADPAQLDQLKAVSGVKYVVPLQRFKLKLDAAEQLINVPAAWNLLGGTGNAGAGVRIGIIDTGIQSTHPAFQDSSLTPPAGFPACDTPANCGFTNNKIIVARSYVSLVAAGSYPNPAATSRPDDFSARDRVGHGTAVAMAAAGVTNAGPSDTITGVAPKAFLGNYKVFGSPGVNDYATGDAIVSALDDAFNDGMDIVVLSLGGPAVYGPLDTGTACGISGGQPCDFEASQVQTAVQNGMLVVAAAGNEGSIGSVQPTLNSIDSPGDAPNALTVAATTNSHQWFNSVTVNGLGSFRAQPGTGPVPSANFSAPLSDVANVGDPQACSTPPANSLTGTIALVQRGVCTFQVKVQNLQVTGAIGVIFTNNPGDNTTIAPGGLGSTLIPAAFIGAGDGQTIRNYLKTNPATTAGISPTISAYPATAFNTIASFSSRGPVLGSGALKPDVAAVGTDLYLAGQTYDPNGELYSVNGYLVSQGTSFSTPQMAGLAALVKQNNPNLTALQLKSAIVNTATQDVTDGGATASVLAVGAGKANGVFAVSTNLVASPVNASFGILKTMTPVPTQQIQLTNVGSSTLSLSVTLNRRTAENNAHISVDLPNLTLAAGQTGNINLTLTGTLPNPGIYEGLVTIQGAANTVQIPWLYIVGDGNPASIVSVAGDGDDGTVGQQNAEGGLLLQVVDTYGVPVPGLPVQFKSVSGGGVIRTPDRATDSYGFAGANDVLGSTPGTDVFSGTAGGLTTTFTITTQAQPVISPNGAVSAANFISGQPLAPGAYIALFGSNLSPVSQSYTTPYLPVSIDSVNVSFDTPTISVPGHLVYVSPGQVNVQIPWEMQQALQQGQTAVQVKVNIQDSSGALYVLPLAAYSPAFFEFQSGGQSFVAALDETNKITNTSNPVAQGHVVQLFANGLGPVTNQPASGDPAPTNPLAQTTTQPIVTIGNQTAIIQFSGMTPGNAGLYQINAVVPNTGAGVQPITVSIGGVVSTVSHLAVK